MIAHEMYPSKWFSKSRPVDGINLRSLGHVQNHKRVLAVDQDFRYRFADVVDCFLKFSLSCAFPSSMKVKRWEKYEYKIDSSGRK